MSDKQASLMCNQVLRIVKDSNLNYLVNETPFSAYVTIRKKFVKNKEAEHSTAVDDFALSDLVLRQENISLRQKVNGLESDKGYLNIEKEELELKLEEMDKKNRILEENIALLETEKNSAAVSLEVSKGQLAHKSDKLAKKLEDEKELNAKLKESRAKNEKFENIQKEKIDEIVMLEFTLKNRDDELARLNTKLRKYSCDECDFSFEMETDLKIHIVQLHQHLCQNCNSTFEGKTKFMKHVCRIQVENPTSFWFYTKDWFEHGKCIRVFDNQAKEEVVVIHGEDCILSNSCISFPENFKKEKYFKDTHKILHLPASSYMISNKIKWEELWGMKNIIIDQGYNPAKSK